jgi:hypothetical protein
VARISIFSPSGGDYYAATVLAGDLPADGVYEFKFFSPPYNGWGYPPTVLVSSTGQSQLGVGLLAIEPDRFRSLGLALLWLTGTVLAGAAVVAGAVAGRPAVEARPSAGTTRPHAPRGVVWLNALLALATVLSFGWSLLPQARTYRTVDQLRTVGDIVSDEAAFGGQTMLADPPRGHEAGKLAFTQPERYAAGAHRLTVSLAALPGGLPLGPETLLARVRVIGSDARVLAQYWDVSAADLPADGQYYSLSFEFENPTDEALTFILDYTGAAGVKSDRLIVEPVR